MFALVRFDPRCANIETLQVWDSRFIHLMRAKKNRQSHSVTTCAEDTKPIDSSPSSIFRHRLPGLRGDSGRGRLPGDATTVSDLFSVAPSRIDAQLLQVAGHLARAPRPARLRSG